MLEDLGEVPALELGEGAGLGDEDLVAFLGLALLVVGVELGGLADDLLEAGMRNAALNFDDDGLGHLGGSDDADARLLHGLLFSGGGCGGCLAHVLRMEKGVRRVGLRGLLGGGSVGTLGDDGLDAGDLLADLGETGGIFKLAALLLDAQVKGLLLQLATAGGKFFDAGLTEFFDLHNSVLGSLFSVLQGLFVHALAGDEAAADADLVRGEAAGFTGSGFIDARDLEHHVSGKDDGDPEFGSAFTFTHSDFRRTLGDRLVREDADEDLALTLEEAGEGHTAGFDLVVLDPAAVEELKAEVTEVELVAAGGIATAIAALLLAVFGSAGEKGHCR